MRKIGPRRCAAFLLAGLTLTALATGGALAQERELTSAAELHDNLWLCEALMGEIVDATLVHVEPAPGAIRLVEVGKYDATPLLRQVAYERLTSYGYDVYTDVEDTARQGAVDYVYRFDVKELDLGYPEVGRTLGIWRRWVDRDLKVTADVTVIEEGSGRIVFDDVVQRQYSDRIGGGELEAVRSTAFPFTDPPLGESGWQRRIEEIVVLGTLAGMVAVYFANTGN